MALIGAVILLVSGVDRALAQGGSADGASARSLRVLVLGPSGAPASGVELHLFDKDAAAATWTVAGRTDERGLAELSFPRALGRFELWGSHKELGSTGEWDLQQVAPAEGTTMRLRLQQRRSVRVQVLDRADLPGSGARVHVRAPRTRGASAQPRYEREFPCDAAGMASFSLSSFGPGYEMWASRDAETSARVSLAAGSGAKLEFALRLGGEHRVRVQVRGPADEILEDASVVAFSSVPGRLPAIAQPTGDAGFEIPLREAGSYWIGAAAAGWGGATPVEVLVVEGRPVPSVVVHLAGLDTLRGRARWTDGKPVAGAACVLVPSFGSEELEQPRVRALLFGEMELGGRTAADGSFAIPGAARDVEYSLEVTPDGLHPECHVVVEHLRVPVPPLDVVVDARTLCGTSFDGRVSRSSKPGSADNARVQLWMQGATREWRLKSETRCVTGRFRFEGLQAASRLCLATEGEPGRWTWTEPFVLGQESGPAANTAQPVEAEARLREEHTLELAEPGSLLVRVSDRSGGVLLDASLCLEPDCELPLPRLDVPLRGTDGTFELTGLSPGAYRLRSKVGDAPEKVERTTIRAGRQTTLEVVLER